MVRLFPYYVMQNKLTVNQKRCACILLCTFNKFHIWSVLIYSSRRPFNIRESVNDTTWVSEDPSKPPYFIPAGTKSDYI